MSDNWDEELERMRRELRREAEDEEARQVAEARQQEAERIFRMEMQDAPQWRGLRREEIQERLVYVRDQNAVVDLADKPMMPIPIAAAKNLWAASTVQDPDRRRPQSLFEDWVCSPRRKTVHDVVHAIGGPRYFRDRDGRVMLNLWSDTPPPKTWDRELVGVFLQHVEFLIPDLPSREHFLDWLAHTEQDPGQRPQHGFLMITPEFGIGRNLLASFIEKAWPGEVALNVDVMRLLEGNFNEEVSRTRMAVADEVYFGARGQYNLEARLRQEITAEHRTINKKYGGRWVERNSTRWLAFSNHAAPLPIPEHDRRWWVVHNPTERRGTDYYSRLVNAMSDKRAGDSLRGWMAERNIERFKPGSIPPLNVAKKEMIAAMKHGLDEELESVLEHWPTPYVVFSDLAWVMNIERDKKMSSRIAHMMTDLGWMAFDGRRRLLRVSPDGRKEYKLERVWYNRRRKGLLDEREFVAARELLNEVRNKTREDDLQARNDAAAGTVVAAEDNPVNYWTALAELRVGAAERI